MKNIRKPIEKIMISVNDMTIAKKTTLLFVIMVVGMLFIGSFAHLSIKRIKADLDTLYEKRMVPVISLEKIKDIYRINILDTLRDIESQLISAKDGESVILLAQELIRRDWSEYKAGIDIDKSGWISNKIKSTDLKEDKRTKKLENVTIDVIEKKIRQIDYILIEIFNLFDRNMTKEALSLLRDDLYPSIKSINIHLTQLISLNLEIASRGKQRTEIAYKKTFIWILFATIGTIFVAALLAIVILQNIRRLHEKLADMVDKKTKELQDLNSALEEKIAFEVEQSRQKDQIMFRQSRLAAMGEMVGNIAHQWRQPLNAIVLVIQSFKMKSMLGKLDDEFIDKQVNEGIKLGDSMSKTIDDFRNFFNPNKRKEIFCINRVMKEAIDLIRPYYENFGISINFICKNDFEVLGYPSEFSQALMNLFSNSKDILKEKKEREKYIEIIVKVQNNSSYGEILIIDNGGGIPEEVVDRVFEPYFTTKHQSSGTGIGLYMTKEIIGKHMNSSIEVENISHKFGKDKNIYHNCACFKIKMPIKQKEDV